MQIDAAATDSTSATIYVQQEGAYVMLNITEGAGTISALLTPDLAEKMSFEFSRLAQESRKFGSDDE